MSTEGRTYIIEVWRQESSGSEGDFETHTIHGVNPNGSFLEMLDVLNETLVLQRKRPITFAHDCREGICGTCGFMIDGQAHGPETGTTVCQLHMRRYPSGTKFVLEPWRATAFPVLQDLMVDRAAFDRIQHKGGYISFNAGNAPDGNAVPISQEVASDAFDAAACIGCGACVASCKNASAMLFVAAKVGHLNTLPQGKPEAARRAWRMVLQMDEEGFGSCTNTLECEAACPKEISAQWIQRLNRDFLGAATLSNEGLE